MSHVLFRMFGAKKNRRLNGRPTRMETHCVWVARTSRGGYYKHPYIPVLRLIDARTFYQQTSGRCLQQKMSMTHEASHMTCKWRRLRRILGTALHNLTIYVGWSDPERQLDWKTTPTTSDMHNFKQLLHGQSSSPCNQNLREHVRNIVGWEGRSGTKVTPKAGVESCSCGVLNQDNFGIGSAWGPRSCLVIRWQSQVPFCSWLFSVTPYKISHQITETTSKFAIFLILLVPSKIFEAKDQNLLMQYMNGFPGPRVNPYRPHQYDQAVTVETWRHLTVYSCLLGLFEVHMLLQMQPWTHVL